MKTVFRVFVAYIGTQIVVQPMMWWMDGDRIDYVSHAVVYGAIAPIVLAAGAGMAAWAVCGFE